MRKENEKLGLMNLLYLLMLLIMQMQQQEQLINSLIEQQQTSAYQQQVNIDVTDNQLSVARVVTAKYKVYVIILLILSVVLGTNFLPAAWHDFTDAKANLQVQEQKILSLNKDIVFTTEQQKQWFLADRKSTDIIACFNDKKDCELLPPQAQKNLKAIVSYLQL